MTIRQQGASTWFLANPPVHLDSRETVGCSVHAGLRNGWYMPLWERCSAHLCCGGKWTEEALTHPILTFCSYTSYLLSQNIILFIYMKKCLMLVSFFIISSLKAWLMSVLTFSGSQHHTKCQKIVTKREFTDQIYEEQ